MELKVILDAVLDAAAGLWVTICAIVIVVCGCFGLTHGNIKGDAPSMT